MSNKSGQFIFRDSGFRKLAFEFLRTSMGLFTEFQIHHPENMVKNGAVIFAANHLSSFDAIILQLVIQRPLCFMSKAELFVFPPFAWGLNRLGSFPVKRGEFDRQSMLNASGVLAAGLALMMFPEGTRTYGKGMVEARSGTAHFAMRSHCRIVPVAISGAEKILKSGLHKTLVEITFCDPIQPEEKETAGQLTTRLMRSIAGRVPEPLRGFYA